MGVSEILIEKNNMQKLIRVPPMMTIILRIFEKEKAKFFQTILYLLGGRQVINYMRTISSVRSKHLGIYVAAREKELLRTLSKEEAECFEKIFIEELKEFFISLRTTNNKEVINHLVEENLSNIMREDYADYEEQIKPNPSSIYPLEEGHYVLLFCMDTHTFIHLIFGDISKCK